MKIRKVKWQNHPVLGNLELDFTRPDGTVYENIVLIGENGSGKTSVMESIGAFLNIGSFDEFVSVTYDFSCKASKIVIEGDSLVISYIYYDEAERNKSKGRREDEVRDYLDPQNGYLNLSSWGVRDAKCVTEVSIVKAVKG